MAPDMHGRSEELAVLHQARRAAEGGRPQLVVLYGRRRTGKTFLVHRFLEQLEPGVGAYHACSYMAAEQELGSLLKLPAIAERRNPTDAPLESIDDQLVALEVASRDRLLVAVIDELPYLIEDTERFPAALQKFWDRIATAGTNCRLLLILTGSAISTMTEVVSSGGPLFTRPTTLLQLHPFDFPTSASFLGVSSDSPQAEQQSVVEARAACGGYPVLLAKWDVKVKASTNLRRLASGPLDPLISMSSVLLLDMPDARGIRSTLSAIGRGAHKHSEIQNLANQRIDSALSTLQAGGFVSSQVPIGNRDAKSAARKIYRIADEHLLFYFTMVDPYRQLFEGGQGRAVLDSASARWDTLLAAAFEREARAHAVRMVQNTELEPGTLIGEWWTDRPEQAQLDVVGVDGMSGQWRIVGEAKWVNRFSGHEFRRFQQALSIAGSRVGFARQAIWVRDRSTVDIPSGNTFSLYDVKDLFTAPSTEY